MIDLGTVRPGSTIRIPFSSFDKDDGSSITMTNYAVGDILAYKDGSTTERASTSGYTATTDFDAKTGKHVAILDLADNTTAGFWNAGSEYLIAIDAVTIDGVTTGGWIARFRIGYPNAWFDTTIATLASQTSFTLTVGPAEDDALNGCTVLIHDIASLVQCSLAIVDDYTGATKTVTLAAGATFTVAAGDNISIMFPQPLQPTVAARKLDVSTTGEAGIDWANIGAPTTAQGLTGTTIATSQVVASVTGAVGSVTGAVGSVTGNVGGNVNGNVVGSVGSVVGLTPGNLDVAVSTRASAAQATAIQADTDDIQTRLPAALVGGRMSSDAVAISGSTAAADAVEANIANLDATVSSRATPAQVNAEVVDGLNVDTYAEPTGVPPATDTLVNKIGRVHQALRNQVIVNSVTGKKQFFDDAGAALWEKDLTDAAGVYTESEANLP